MDFLVKPMSLYTSKRYEAIYAHFRQEEEILYHKLFLICAALGARKGNKVEMQEQGLEFRPNTYSSDERNLLYAIVLNDDEAGHKIEEFADKKFYSKARKVMESYAEGGMEILVEEVFQERWNGYKLDSKHKNYDIDVLKYVTAVIREVPF